MNNSIIKESWEDYKEIFNTFRNCLNFKGIFNFDFIGLLKSVLFILVCVAFPILSLFAVMYGSVEFSLWLLLLIPFILFTDIVIINYFVRLNEKWGFV